MQTAPSPCAPQILFFLCFQCTTIPESRRLVPNSRNKYYVLFLVRIVGSNLEINAYVIIFHKYCNRKKKKKSDQFILATVVICFGFLSSKYLSRLSNLCATVKDNARSQTALETSGKKVFLTLQNFSILFSQCIPNQDKDQKYQHLRSGKSEGEISMQQEKTVISWDIYRGTKHPSGPELWFSILVLCRCTSGS